MWSVLRLSLYTYFFLVIPLRNDCFIPISKLFASAFFFNCNLLCHSFSKFSIIFRWIFLRFGEELYHDACYFWFVFEKNIVFVYTTFDFYRNRVNFSLNFILTRLLVWISDIKNSLMCLLFENSIFWLLVLLFCIL